MSEIQIREIDETRSVVIYKKVDGGRDPPRLPLIAIPHGGPHSVSTCAFKPGIHFFVSLGYAVLLINYPGSLGRDLAYVESLCGKVGDLDVKSCYKAVDHLIGEDGLADKDRLFLFGGSHGGFLVTHLAGQFPNMFKAVATRNPVINIARMSAMSDIPDWTYVEAGSEYGLLAKHKQRSGEMMDKMWAMSPIAHVHNIKAPFRIFIGRQDARVPPDQGLELYQALKGRQMDVKLFAYDDCHSLASVPVDADVLINTAIFFAQTTK